MLFNKYQLRGNIQKRGYSSTALVEDEDGKLFFAKWIIGVTRDSQASKLLYDKLRHLKKATHASLPLIVEYDWDEQQGSYCIISEYKAAETLEARLDLIAPAHFLRGIIQLLSCLQFLRQNHRISHGDITPANILVDASYDFYLIDFGISDIASTLSQEKELQVFAVEFAAPEKYNREIPKGFPYQSDIFSIGKVISWYQNQHDYLNYLDLDHFVDQACKLHPAERISFNSAVEWLERTMAAIDHQELSNVQIATKSWGIPEELVEDFNTPEFAPKFKVSPNAKGENILMQIATAQFLCNALWLVNRRQLLILSYDHKYDIPDQKRYNDTLKYGVTLNVPTRFVTSQNSIGQWTNLEPVFRKLQLDKKKEGDYIKGKKFVNQELSFYKDLINKELEVLNAKSLKLHFTSFQKKSDTEIWFTIGEDAKYSGNGQILNHIDQATPPHPTEFDYILSATADKKKIQESIRLTGIAFDFNSASRQLKFRDCERLDFSKIPQNGYLFENISRQEEEKKRQLEAIRKVETNAVQNRDLIHYLFNSSDLIGKFIERNSLDRVFQTDKNGNELKYSPNQTQAIVNALAREPLTVIQGPPGTGKTTVITEIVLQILNRTPEAKILITSQTNDAVDNVLDNLLEGHIPLIRLSGVRPPKSTLQKHTLERKIEGWKQETRKRAQKNWNRIKQDFLSELESENPIVKSIVDLLGSTSDWKLKKSQIEKVAGRDRGIDIPDAALKNQETFIKALSSQTNCDVSSFFSQFEIHKDWLTSISSLDEHSSVNQKLIDSIRVVGATTNHIASKKYGKYNFEFDYVIMDESGKATTAEALIPIVLAEKLILVGDHRQLRPMLTANREVEKWLRNKFKTELAEYDSWDDYFNRPSLFETVITQIDPTFKSQLEECRRMPADSVQMTSKCFYQPHNERILPVYRAKEKEHNLDLKLDSSLIFLDTGNSYKSDVDGGGSSKNPHSASLIPKLLQELDRYDATRNYSIGIITGYTAQVREIRNVLRKDLNKHKLKNINPTELAISVVDKFQGLEKDIIIFDLVRSQQNTLGFLANDNRINVALSRHKKLLIIVGNYDWLVQAKPPVFNDGLQAITGLQNYLRGLKKEWIVNDIQQIF